MALTMGDIILILVVLYVSVSYSFVVEGGRSISIEEDHLDLDKQLKILNKSPVKTIQVEDGDIIDCINIYEQPAFDNPLLKDHKIQMKPTSSPGSLSKETSSSSINQLSSVLKRFDCPENTVPIRRTSKEDLLRAKSLSESFNNSGIRPMFSDVPGQHVAIIKSRDNVGHPFYGVRGMINTAAPNVQNDQYSGVQVWLEAGPADDINTIQVGWGVSPSLFGDNKPRVFVYWSAKPTTGCYNLLCPGFVQIDKELTVGTTIDKISKYGGTQYAIDFVVFQDNATGDWWLTARDKHIGYWPKNLLPHMNKDQGQAAATFVAWGGLVRSAPNGPTPPMGNGHYPDMDYTEACSVVNMQTVDATNTLVDLNEDENEIHIDNVDCYRIHYGGSVEGQGKSLLFGGPGGDKC